MTSVSVSDLTEAAKNAVDNWGMNFRQKVHGAFADACRRLRIGYVQSSGSSLPPLKVGTDCSGAEAPIWALRAMQVPHEHVFSCDVDENVRKFIKSVCPPSGSIYCDMLSRDRSGVPAHDVYVAGFPCKPFSSLRRHSTRLMREETAKPFFEVRRMISHHRPKVAVLENVMGILAVMDKVVAHLQRIPGYIIIVMPINCADLGQPVNRPRYYFVLVRRDCALTSSVDDLATIVRDIHAAVRSSSHHDVSKFMLLNSCPAVREFLVAQRQRADREVARSHRPGSPFSHFAMTSWRQVDAWASAKAKQMGNAPAAADVSQAASRARVMTAVSPTLTPGGQVVVEAARRPIMPIEKLLLHGFPVHRMAIPSDIGSSAVASLGGSTMHVVSVALALQIGILLVHPSSSASSTSTADGKSEVVYPFPVGAMQKKKKSTPPASRPRSARAVKNRPAKKHRVQA